MSLHGLTEVLYNIPFLDVLQYLPIERHLHCFQVLTIRNKASVDILVQLFFFFFCMDITFQLLWVNTKEKYDY